MPSSIERIKSALHDLQQGKMIILTDNPSRENEGDLIVAAECITPTIMNFMIRHGTGIVCLSLTSDYLAKFNLPLMVPSNENTSVRGTPFTISIDAKTGITTGVSAEDRTKTIQTMLSEYATADDLVKPGHIFPLQAQSNGVLEREGHTEGSVDLVRLAGFKSAAVLCEIMNADGTMARGSQLEEFAKNHHLSIVSIDELITYRLWCENMIEDEASASLPIENYGLFNIKVIKEKISGIEHIILIKENNQTDSSILVRIHSSCMTGDLFSSSRCDCHPQLHYSLNKISKEGGMLIYLNQEGRGVGLLNKIKAYSLQEEGLDTVEANHVLGLPIDARKYHIAANFLRNNQINNIKLLTNNPNKVESLKKFGITEITREPIPDFINDHNVSYLHTKKIKLNHFINID